MFSLQFLLATLSLAASQFLDLPIEYAGSHSFDVDAGLFWDWNIFVKIKIGSLRQDLHLIPDTGMNEITLIHESCESCATPATGKWSPRNDTAVEDTYFDGTVDYFYTSHLFEV